MYNRIEVQDEKGAKSVRRSDHVKRVDLDVKVIQQIPSKEVLQQYGRATKLLITAKDILSVGFNLHMQEDEVNKQSAQTARQNILQR